ncbi:MAG: hypothetical protein O3C34_00925 [Proteobacteria bacterium]|nr:hypothetical protein [Pseudomonadota bacterium]
MAREILLIGSIPLKSADDVFSAVGCELDGLIHRIPDGESGDRTDWVQWQSSVFGRIPFVERIDDSSGPSGQRQKGPQYRVRSGFPTAAVQFGPLGYAAAAKVSYQAFTAAKAKGTIAADCRLQVGVATALSVVAQHVDDAFQIAVEPAYENRLLEEIAEIASAIPHHELAIQWNLATELSVIEGRRPVHFRRVWDGILDRIVRSAEAVPDGVELGLHFCFRDFEFNDFPLPADLDRIVDLANGLSGLVGRPIDWMHFPVPKYTRDGRYFAPLDRLTLRDETQLFLGVIHTNDDIAITHHQIALAAQRVAAFGVASECGLGDLSPHDVAAILTKHRLIASPG